MGFSLCVIAVPLSYNVDDYVKETHDFMRRVVADDQQKRAELAIDRLKHILFVFSGMGKPTQQEIDTDKIAIRLFWRRGEYQTSILVNDEPGEALEWSAAGVRQKLLLYLRGTADI